jgi:hypothetical protein
MLLFEKDFYYFEPEEIISILWKMGSKISNDYICDLITNEDNYIIFYSIDNIDNINIVNIRNCPSALIYKTEQKGDTINVYISFIATSYRFRKVGYASLFIKEFMTFIKETFHKNEIKEIKIILDSIMDAVSFYEHIGFKWVNTNDYNEHLHIPENSDSEHFIMIYEMK